MREFEQSQRNVQQADGRNAQDEHSIGALHGVRREAKETARQIDDHAVGAAGHAAKLAHGDKDRLAERQGQHAEADALEFG